MPHLKEGTSLWRAMMEARERREKPAHSTPKLVAERTPAEETVALPETQDANFSNTSTTHLLGSLAEHKNRQSGTSAWVRRTTRNVNEVSTDKVLTEEEQLEAALAGSLAQGSVMLAKKGPVKQTRKRQSKSKDLLTPQKEQEAASQVTGEHNALKRPQMRVPSKRTLVEQKIDSLAQSPDIDEPIEAEDFEQAKELERQRQLLFLVMLERQEGYTHPDHGKHESAMRSTLVHNVDNDDFTAAFILREMANSDITVDPASKDFVQRLMNSPAPGRTLESTNSAKKENPREGTPLRRSKRNKTAAAPGTGKSPSKAIKPEQPAPEHLRLDEGEGFMPSAGNNFKFKFDSPTGLRAREVDALLKPPNRPKAFPDDLAGEKAFLYKSYKVFGAKPKSNATDEMVKQMDFEHALTQQEVERAMAEDDRWNEIWGVK
ncbi:hypothetical protein BKA58DRAFT_396876 [Alternaria rosae]|uniref:uncharacterized protein n=1 Tax=Alternaria rosae TaxID=1187941 RepID=UPI001E8DF741|nr:uncharacterized protein BKA58DRAFT_396876 [Alternaria rosae]KAH6882603.1 hypothetical protein BKA58DRAFT_396876 [Alternaria rosae]